MGRSVKVAVIGGGVAGLCAARELQREGHDVVIFEKSNGIGGMWVYDPIIDSDPISLDPTRDIVHSSLYLSMRTNLPRQLMSFYDYPFPKESENGDPRSFPGHEEVLWFLKKFADDFGLAQLARFNTEVVRVSRVGVRNDEWLVESRNRGSDLVSREVFVAVVVCSGCNSEPEIADISGIERWPGYQIHSHNYRVPEQFRGQTVVVIGFGPSAFDISRDIATEAKEVHIATRNPNVEVKRLENHKNIWQHMMIEQVYEDGTISFQEGSLLYADVILYCTGYRYHYPFLETNGILNFDENCVRPLYRHVFPPQLAPWLSFIGIPSKSPQFMTFDLQSKWVARVLSGKILLPDEEEQMVSTKEFYRRLEELGVPKRFTHVLNPTGFGYQNWLLAQIGLPPLEEWREEMYKESLKNIMAMQDGYKDEWKGSYWEAIIEEFRHLDNGHEATFKGNDGMNKK